MDKMSSVTYDSKNMLKVLHQRMDFSHFWN
jgi:hypothetical protein